MLICSSVVPNGAVAQPSVTAFSVCYPALHSIKKAINLLDGFFYLTTWILQYAKSSVNIYSAACSNKFNISLAAFDTDVPGPKIATAPASYKYW
ncbi:hypothetical protein SAMN06265379_105226 [Saccharicrinis carchari]|uniref:Uncharacterized protein n=1 Tax=Saccharicrinis carchari TaxID=1168039 RepID=A0A521DIR7_SACCC|nr:hypothetical protein SAMN06265379_105226 [Saccharicrinis carchari]